MSRSFRLALSVTLALTAIPAAAASAADFTWSGAAPVSSPGWSDPANWAGGVAPSDDIGALSFPALDCPQSPPTTCETSTDDVPNVEAQSLDFNGPYSLTGAPLSIGAGGIQATTGGLGPPGIIANPIVLMAPQSWLLQGNPLYPIGGTLRLSGGVTGTAEALQVRFSGDATLVLGPDTEVGAVSASGPGALLIDTDQAPGAPASPDAGELNASDGNPVQIADGTYLESSSQMGQTATGPLTSDGGKIYPNGTLAVNGPLSINAGSVTGFELAGSGQSDQINATGAINLGGTLSLGAGVPFDAFKPGDTFTLLTSQATISGTFANAPQGALLAIGSNDQPDAQINYTPHAVTATVTDFSVTASPQAPVTNEPVTLTAGGGPNYPPGSVTFGDFATPAPPGTSPVSIPGCLARPLAPSGGNPFATCRTSFTTGLWGLHATFTQSATGPPPLGYDASIAVKPASTTATVVSSSPTATFAAANGQPGATVSYRTTLRPQFAGPSHPTGNLSLLDHGRPVPACAGMRLSQTAVAQLASCTIRYTHAGRHVITGRYAGNVNFTGSSSRPLTIIVPTAATDRAIHITRRGAMLRGRIRDERAVVTWRFVYWTSTKHRHYTKRRQLSSRSRSVSVRMTVSGLRPGIRYRYRLMVTTLGHKGVGPVSWTGRTVSLSTRR